MRLKHFNLDPGAQIFLACSDSSRLRILNLIFTNGELCISDLERILDFTQSKTSRHLLYLKNSGILTFRKYNQWIFYQIINVSILFFVAPRSHVVYLVHNREKLVVQSARSTRKPDDYKKIAGGESAELSSVVGLRLWF